MTDPGKKTPLWDTHVRLGARMVPFGGWSMPLQYEGILAEHQRTRTDAAVFDTCHMGRFLVSGRNSLQALSVLLTTDLRRMKDGQCRYGFLLREDGGILDDTIAYRFNEERWMVVVNAGTQARDREWIAARLPAGIEFEDASVRMAKLDVQGPRSPEIVSRLIELDAAGLGYFRFTAFRYGGSEAVVSRTGYTGEKGVELYVSAGHVVELWSRLLAAGVKPAGLGARDTLRIEAGLPLYGHELSEDVTPVEAGMERYAAKPEDFVGKAAVTARLREGPASRLMGFRIEGRQSARAENPVLAGGAAAGQVTSGSFSPTLQCVIGFAYVRAGLAKPGTRVQVDTGRNRLEAELVAPPFYKAKG